VTNGARNNVNVQQVVQPAERRNDDVWSANFKFDSSEESSDCGGASARAVCDIMIIIICAAKL
jgi:hypothetical protein